MTIKEVCEQFDITADTLRYYERVGAIPQVGRTAGGIRNYTEEDLKWIQNALCLRGAGVPVEMIIDYVKLFQQGDDTFEARCNLLKEARVEVLAAREKYDKALEKLNYKIDKYEDIDVKTRSIITVVALMASGVTDSSLKFHLENAKNHGVTKKEIAAVITHVVFYAGWPKGWAVFNMAKEVWTEENVADDAKEAHAAEMVFPIGAPNDAFAQYFIGQSYLAPISTEQVGVFNVTFEPGCRNNWHIHQADKGGGQILVCVAGRGYYQEWGKDAILMKPGDCINIPAGVKHWHGAAPDSWFSHLAIEVPGENGRSEWLEAVDEKQYGVLK